MRLEIVFLGRVYFCEQSADTRSEAITAELSRRIPAPLVATSAPWGSP